LRLEVLRTRCEVGGPFGDCFTPRDVLGERRTCLRRGARARLVVDERLLMVEGDAREGLAGSLAARDEVVEALPARGEGGLGAAVGVGLLVDRLREGDGGVREVGEVGGSPDPIPWTPPIPLPS